MVKPGNVVFCQYRQPGPPTWLCFRRPVEVVEARRPEEVLAAVQAAERAADRGLYAAGFLAYEAALGFDTAFRTQRAGDLPLVWFGLFEEMTAHTGATAPTDRSSPDRALDNPTAGQPAGFTLGPWEPSVTRDEYEAAIARIHDYIARGHTYQVNYTYRLRAGFAGDPWALFCRLCQAQRGPYGAFVDTGRQVLCSASPELFFRLDGEQLVTRPMKGTSTRGLTLVEDRQRRAALAASPKDRAENAMIVDMMRNDLGRVAEAGSVRVVSAFDVEKYPTVFQMTSTVTGRTTAPVAEILKALFPPASITGAPKVRTMEIIRELEPDPRGPYTGCIGWMGPGRRAEFNVAIRTVTIDRQTGRAEYGVGGGIVWDSVAAAEYAECAAKAAVLEAQLPEFELLETMLYESGAGFFLLKPHLQRVADSAEYFDFVLDLGEVRRRLDALAADLPLGAHRVRLRVGRQGEVALDAAPLPDEPPPRPWRLRLAQRPVSAQNPFLYHKTTHRAVYEAALGTGEKSEKGEKGEKSEKSEKSDYDDAVLWNEQGQVTETAIANLVVRSGGRLITPPVACGLLPGVFRAHLLETGQIEEAVISVEELRRAETIFAVNSVRKWLPAVLV